MKAAKRAVKSAAPVSTQAPAALSTTAMPRAITAPSPAAAWPFPTGSRP
jgi:hypothetical protein